jgi:hypothetical protein
MKRIALCLLAPLLLAQERADLFVINRIKTEAFQNSRVMDHSFYLSDVYGPRLAGSPAYKAAAEWAMKRLREVGLENTRLEKWGPFGRGWANVRFYAAMKEPDYQPLIGVPRPLSLGTGGPVSGAAMLARIATEADMEKFKGNLKGKIVLTEPARPLLPQTDPASRRYTDAELANTALAPDPVQRFGLPAPPNVQARMRAPSPQPGVPANRAAAQLLRNKINQFLKDEGVIATLAPGARGDGGTVFSSAAGSREVKDPLPPAAVSLTAEHYNRIARLLEKNIPVTLELDIDNRVYEEALDTYNVTADLPGGAKKDEVVLLGAHLDSWTFGTGAADNAAGCAVMIEAARILKALDLKMARTVRVGLWSAEEQGLLGSAAYVKEHLADRETMALKPAHAKLSGYFNLDNGTGKVRGVYLQGNDMMRPVFEAWFAPLRDLGVTTVSIRNTGGTDHQSFDAVGIPGFQFIQDPVEYMSRTHHSNMDVYDRLQEGDLMQSAAVVAVAAYHAASRPEMLPRKPLPKPRGR